MTEDLAPLSAEEAVGAALVIAVAVFVLHVLSTMPFDPGAARVTAAVGVLRRARRRILLGEE